MNIYTEPHVRKLGEWFSQTGRPLFLVGGCVRNKLLSLPVSDLDVAAAVAPRRVAELADGHFSVSERSYGLGTVVISQNGGEHLYEYTAFRSDSYGRGGGHRPERVRFTDSMAPDAARRDFTVNALYAHTDGEVVDPLHTGLRDLENRILRMAGPKTMEEDALRILRMARFSAELGFAIDPATYAKARACARNLANISGERVCGEFFKILMADAAYGEKTAVLDGLHTLADLGALRHILPGLLAGEGFVQCAVYHKYDVLEHGLRTCAAACPDLVVRLAALLHDVAKPAVYGADGSFCRHPEEGAKMAREALYALKAEKKLAQDVAQLVGAHMFDLTNTARKGAVARMAAKLGREQFLRLCCLREADFAGSGMGNEAKSAAKWRETLAELERQNAPIELKALAADGNDIMRELKIPPGKRVGLLLSALQAYAIKKPSQNNYKSLIRYARMLYTGDSGEKDATRSE